jgi:hypothetical protein
LTGQLSRAALHLWALEDDSLKEITKEGAAPIANNDAAELEDAVKIALAAKDILLRTTPPLSGSDCNDIPLCGGL